MGGSHHHSHEHGSDGHDSGHAHGPGHSHLSGLGGRSRHADARRADRARLWGALGLTVVIALAEGIGGFLTNSLALLSDAGHMLTDISALGLSLLALWFSAKPANLKKTYGYYRLEILSALANGVILLGLTVLIVYEAIHRLRTPEHVKVGPLILIATIGLAANLGSLFFLRHQGSINVRSAFLHVLGDAMSSFGVIVGGIVMKLTGWYTVDPLISIGISVVIVVGAYRLVKDAVDVLLEAVPEHVDMEAVKELMGKTAGVVSVHDLHVWTISSGMYALSAHLVVCDPSTCNNDDILTAVKHELLERFGIDHTTIQIESQTYAHVGEVH